MAHLREAAIVTSAGLVALAAMRVTIELIAYDSPFLPGAISAIFIALWIFLIRRYGPRGPVDPRRQRMWFLSGIAAAGGLAISGLIAVAVLSIERPYAEQGASCPARSRTNAYPPNDEVTCATIASPENF